MLKHIAAALAFLAVVYVLAVGTVGARRFLDQRDEIIQIEKFSVMLKAAELQGNVHCDPS